MECLIGIKGKDFVLMATDCTAGRSIIAMKKGAFILTCVLLVMVQTGVGKMRNCGMRNAERKCGTDRVEKYRGMVCNLPNAEYHYHSQN